MASSSQQPELGHRRRLSPYKAAGGGCDPRGEAGQPDLTGSCYCAHYNYPGDKRGELSSGTAGRRRAFSQESPVEEHSIKMCDEDVAALVVDNGSGMCKVTNRLAFHYG